MPSRVQMEQAAGRTVVYVWLDALPRAPAVRSPRLPSRPCAAVEEEQDYECDAEEECQCPEDDRDDFSDVGMMRSRGRRQCGAQSSRRK